MRMDYTIRQIWVKSADESTTGKSSNYIGFSFSTMRFVYFTLNKSTKRSMQLTIINFACFGMILVEISPAGAFLRQFFFFFGGGGVGSIYKKKQLRCIILPDLTVTWSLTEIIIKPIL